MTIKEQAEEESDEVEENYKMRTNISVIFRPEVDGCGSLYSVIGDTVFVDELRCGWCVHFDV